MLRKVFEGTMFGALVAVAAVWVAMWAGNAFGQGATNPSWTHSNPATDLGYPTASQPFSASGTGTTSATVTVTAPTGFSNIYVCTLTMTEAGGSATTVNGSLTNTVGGTTLMFAQLGQLVVTFTPCIPNNGSAIVATTPTATAATASAVTVTGFYY